VRPSCSSRSKLRPTRPDPLLTRPDLGLFSAASITPSTSCREGYGETDPAASTGGGWLVLVVLCRVHRAYRLAVSSGLRPGLSPTRIRVYLITVVQPAARGPRSPRTDARGAPDRQDPSRTRRAVAHVVTVRWFWMARPSPMRPNAGAIFLARLRHSRKRAARGPQAPSGSWRICASGLARDSRTLLSSPSRPPAGAWHRHWPAGFKMMVQGTSAGRGITGARKRRRRRIVTVGQTRTPGPRRCLLAVQHAGRPKVLCRYRPRGARRWLGVFGQPRVREPCRSISASAYVNDFNYLGRTYQVTAQADAPSREDISRHHQSEGRENDKGQMVAIGSIAEFPRHHGSLIVCPRYNLYPAGPEVPRGTRCRATLPATPWRQWKKLARQKGFPTAFGFEWTGTLLTRQEARRQPPALLVFGASIVFVFSRAGGAVREAGSLPLAGHPDRADVPACRG